MKKTIYTKQSKELIEAMVDMRTRAELTQRDLAERLNKHQSFVAKCELGERRIDLVEWYWICEACGFDPIKETSKLLKRFAS